jgi:ADP-heptose:LPS heptosyltransferase
VVLHPGAASASRRWPAPRWAELAGRLADAGHTVAVTGSAGEAALCERVATGARHAVRVRTPAGGPTAPRPDDAVRSLAGTLDLQALADVVGLARLLVCGDTGVAHLATALGTPSVLLFGPVSPAAWGPAIDPELHAVLWHGDGAGDPHGSQVDPALAAIGVEEVWEATEQLVAAAPPRPRSTPDPVRQYTPPSTTSA